MAIYANYRVSTQHQLLERQTKNNKAIYLEIKTLILSGEIYPNNNRTTRMEKARKEILKADNMIVFDLVSRMSRQVTKEFELYKRLYEMGVNLIFLEKT